MTEIETERKNIFKNSIWILKYIARIDFKYILIACLKTILNGISPIILLKIMQSILNQIQKNTGTMKSIVSLVIVYLLLNFVIDIFEYLFNYYDSKFSMEFNLDLSGKILNKASKLSLKDYESSDTYDLINRAQYEGGEKLKAYFLLIMNIISSCISVLSYMWILIQFNIIIFFVILIVPAIKFYISNKFNYKTFDIVRSRTNDQRKAGYITHIITYGNFFKELKIYKLFKYFTNKYILLVEKFNKQDLSLEKDKNKSYSIVSIVENLIDGTIFMYIILLTLKKVIYIGNMITYTNIVSNIKSSVTTILNSFSMLIKESLFINQLFEFFNIPEDDNRNKIKIEKIKTIEFKNVNYRYTDTSEYALKNINFKISSNKKLAILGRNGSGKTTLVKLIMGFYSDYEGEILINGIDLKKIDKSYLMNRVATLFQDFSKYEATLKENVGYGNINSNENEILNSIKYFKLDRLSEVLPNGIDTQLGNWFDNGVNVSIGQWQKIALARAFMKNADIYILDEPNAALDVIAENELNGLYSKLLYSKMGIIIAHKFNSLINLVDEIIILDNGKIVGKGTHLELIESNYLYKKMVKLNSLKYTNNIE